VRWLRSSGSSARGTEAIPGRGRRLRVFTSSWGQLESGGSNIGDLAIFEAQLHDLAGSFEVGIASADPASTERSYRVRAFSTGRGRTAAYLAGVLWADAVIVGGGELAQDRSSLFYTPFNLLPLRFAWWLGRPAFAWAVGIGQGGELAPWTPPQLGRWLARARGVTVRDGPSRTSLLGAGLSPVRVVHTADAAFSLAGSYEPGPRPGDVLGAAPRDVSNRSGALLPLELRRRLGLTRSGDAGDADLRQWAQVLDRHLEVHGGRIRLFAFHTGPLSNSDDSSCARVASLMRHSSRADLVRTGDLGSFMSEMGGCRAILTSPLHGAILGLIAGALPVSVPYSTKSSRFMEEAGLRDLSVRRDGGAWAEDASTRLDRAWRECPGIWTALRERRADLIDRAAANRRLFCRMCLEQ